jgi:hypothetical protein
MRMTILDAMSDGNLFGPWFQGGTWNSWRTFLAALFGLPLEDEPLEAYRKYTGRVDAPASPFSECFCIAGRRSGKSVIGAMIATYLSCFVDYGRILARGETGVVMLLASDRRQARVLLGYVNAFFDSIPLLGRMVTERLKESVSLNNRIRIEIHTSSFRSTRGYTVAAAICDEIAFWPTTEDSANPDTEILNALRPAMATVPGALLLAVSSPYARRGALWETHRANYGKNDAPLPVWQAATRVMNPALPQRVVDEALARDAVAASAEFLAQFRTDCELLVSREVIEANTARGCFELPFVQNTRYHGFVDPSGGSSDSMTLAIAHPVVFKNGSGAVLDLVREIKPPFSPDAAVADFAQVLRSYRLRSVVGDRYGSEWVAERFRTHGIEYKASELTRSQIYAELLPLLNSKCVRLLDNQRLASQIAGLERRTSRVGGETIDHGPALHDDLANSAGGALVLASKRLDDSPGPFICVVSRYGNRIIR